mmetsp:Transcript_7860/g.11658  ORF Transcript_7860/g.11658 Transcript_7860/m.11658 type:complete len:500 (+) Transcript_7860:35-1534(+)
MKTILFLSCLIYVILLVSQPVLKLWDLMVPELSSIHRETANAFQHRYLTEDARQRLENKTFQIGIVGSGIGGSGTAVFLKDLLGDFVNITVFEQSDRIGGRTKAFLFDGFVEEDAVDVGATSIIMENRYMRDLIRRYSFSFNPSYDTQTFVYDKSLNKVVFQDDVHPLRSLLSLLSHYFFDLLRVFYEIKLSMLRRFHRIYTLQASLFTFESYEDLFAEVGLFDLTQQTFDAYMKPRLGSLYDHLAIPILRVNYLQNGSVSAFVGGVSTSALVSSFKTLKEGMSSIASENLKAAQATVRLNTKVTSIKRHQVSFSVQKQHDVARFDKVVLAAPLFESNIHLSKPLTYNLPRLPYQTVHVTIVCGVFKSNNSIFPNLSTSPYPIELITTDATTNEFSIVSISLKKPSLSRPGEFIYKIFSFRPVDSVVLDDLFEFSRVWRHSWKAYPFLPPQTQKNHPIRLDSSTYYVNALEQYISTMETELIAAKNVALMLAKDLVDAS